MSEEKVSVILPTLNREAFLLVVLDDLLKQTYKNFDIVIVDQSDIPSSKVLTLAQLNPGKIIYYHVKFRGLPIARNFGWQKATGDIVIFLDDDIRCGTRMVEEHALTMKENNVGVVAGGIDEANKKEEENPKITGKFSYWTATPTRGFQAKRPAEVQHAPGGNFAVRRKIFFEVGGFDEAFSRGAALYEETDFCLRVVQKGYRIVFNPQARVTHLAAATGGCRVPQLGPYLRSMSRNRMMIILRYLSWYHKPVAIVRLFLLNLSYIRSQRDPAAFVNGFHGFMEGLKEGRNEPVTTRYDQGA
jgi:GT2 family glycosyltransferase